MKCIPFAFLLLIPYCNGRLAAQDSLQLDSLHRAYRSMPEDTSRVRLLGELYEAYLYNDVDRAAQYARERIALSRKLGYPEGLAAGFYDLGGYFKNTGQNDSAMARLADARELYESLDDNGMLIRVDHTRAILEMELGRYDSALAISNRNIVKRQELGDTLGLAIERVFRGGIYENKGYFNLAYDDILQAVRLYKHLDNPLRMADALNSLGSLESTMKNYRKSLEYSGQALEIYRQQDDRLFQGVAANAIGQSHILLEEYREAIPFLEESIALSREMQVPVIEGAALRNLGRAYIGVGQARTGLELLDSAIAVHRRAGRPIALVRSLGYASDAYTEAGRPVRALDYLDEAIRMVDTLGARPHWYDLFKSRSDALAQLGRYPDALLAEKEFSQLRDSALQRERVQQVEELRTRFETEKKEQQIAIQEREINLLEAEARVGSLQRILLGSGLLLSLIGFYGVRQKWKRTRAEKSKVDAELAFRQRELTTHALHLARKNELLENLKSKARELQESDRSGGYRELIRTINFDQKDDAHWEHFTRYFENVHKDFSRNVRERFPDVTKNELRYMALMKMNLSSKEIATILNISPDGVKKARQRLRKKMRLAPEESLEASVGAL